jgi:hypothetical protein
MMARGERMAALERIVEANATQLGQLAESVGQLTVAVKVGDTKQEALDQRVKTIEANSNARQMSLDQALQNAIITVVTSSLVAIILHWLLR